MRSAWTRLLGIGLVVWAIALAASPDYPVPRAPTPQPSATGTPLLEPRPLAPQGHGALDGLEFVWAWDGPAAAWQLHVLDASLREVFSAVCAGATRFEAPPELRARLASGEAHYWLVRTELDGVTVRCSPVLFRARP